MDLKAKYEREDNNNRMERTSIGGVLHSTSDGGPVISAKSLKGVTNVLGTRGYTNSNFTSVPTNSSVRPEKKRNVKLDAVHPVEISPLMSADRDRLDKKYSSYSNIEYEYPDTRSQSQSSDINISLVSAPLLRDGIECPSVDPDRAGTTHEADVNICTDTEAGYGGFNKAPLLDPALAKASKYKKTWDGVFLPVSISVFGVVLFIRLPWVIGQCGLYLTLGGIAISYITSGLTTISLAAISTNGFVGDGGPYMMISRCLGPQVGTVIGITFVIANLISSAMFLSGGSESFVTMFNWEQMIVWNRDHKYLTTVVISTIMLIILLLIALLSIEKPFRVICLILTLISLIDAAVCIPSAIYRGPNSEIGFTGWSSKTWYDNLYPDFDADAGFPTVLAVLFPGVTGVMSGVCLSGDLRSGAKAIPRGIGYAWVLSLVTYLAITVIISGSFERWALKEKLTIMSYVTHPYLFFPGEAVSSFAAVLAMVAGSSRVLQAMASDDLLNSRVLRFIGKSSKKSAIFCFALLVQCFILAGDIYTVASILATQAFCVNFMALNMSTFISAVSGVVSFRPIYSFFNHFTAFIGAAFCLGVMFYVSPIAAVAFNIVLISMFAFVDLYIDTSCLPYGDASQPLMFYMIRKWLLRLDERKEHIRHWRPSIIQVNTDPWCSLNLTHLCNNLKKGGIFEQAFVVKGDFSTTVKVCRRWKGWAMDYISASGIKAFALVGFGEDLRSGVQNLLRTCGLGGMRPNTVVISLDELILKDSFLQMYRTFSRVNFNVIGGTFQSEPLISGAQYSQDHVPLNSRGETSTSEVRNVRCVTLAPRLTNRENFYFSSDDEHEPAPLSSSCNRQRMFSWEFHAQKQKSYRDESFDTCNLVQDSTTNKRSFNVVHLNNLGDGRRGSNLSGSIKMDENNSLARKKIQRLDNSISGTYEGENTDRRISGSEAIPATNSGHSRPLGAIDIDSTGEIKGDTIISPRRSTFAPFGTLPDWVDHIQTSAPVINEDIRNALRFSGIKMPKGAVEGMFENPMKAHKKQALRGERISAFSKEAVNNNKFLYRRAVVETDVGACDSSLEESSVMGSTRNSESCSISHHLLSKAQTQNYEGISQYRTKPLKPTLFRRFLKLTGISNASLQSKINLRDNIMHLYRSAGGTDAGYLDKFDENFEADRIEDHLIELMINQRSQTLNNQEADLATYSGFEEFANIVSDVTLVSMSLVIARNIDKLDKNSIKARAKATKGGGKSTIDLWLPEDNDAVMFLMAYSLSRTSIWRKYCDIRVVSVVVNDVDIDQQNIHMKALLKEHRIIATIHTVSLTGEMRRMGIADLNTMEELIEAPSTRFEALNNIIRHHTQNTAIIFCRVEPFSIKPTHSMRNETYEEPEEERTTRMKEWFASIIALSTGLPPILMVSGGSVRGMSTDW